MPLIFWILIIHTGIWALISIIINLLSPQLWDEATTGEKIVGYFLAELQLLKFISISIKIRKRIFALWAKKWRERNE